MRWHDLFSDLESQAQALAGAELAAEVADRTRAEVGRVTLVNRMRAAVGLPIVLAAAGGETVRGELEQVGADWLLVAPDVLVPLAAVSGVSGLPSGSLSPELVGEVASRLSLSSALRAVATQRAVVRVTLRDGSHYVGTPARIGADWLEVDLHDLDEPPRASAIRDRVTVSAAALAVVARVYRPGWE